MNTADRIFAFQNRHKKRLPFAAFAALGFVLLLNLWHGGALTIKASPWLLVGVFACLVHVPLGANSARPQRRQVIPFAALGTLVAFFITVDPLVYSPDGISKPWTPLFVPVFLVFAAVAGAALWGLSALLGRFSLVEKETAPTSFIKGWALCFGAMLALWLPVALAFGPLRISADSYNVIQQALGNYPLSDSHPIAYTLLLRPFLLAGQALGSLTAGAYAFGFVQMCFFAGVLSYSLCWLRRQGAPRLYVLLAFLYFTLSPVFAINSITAWKDIPFNALLLLLCLSLYGIADTGGTALQSRGGMARFLGLCLAVCFMRGNGLPIVALAMAAVVLLCRRSWRRWLACFLPFVLGVLLVLGPVYAAFGVTRLGGVESAAIPLQQVARAVKNGAPLTEEQAAVLEEIIPVEDMKAAYVSASPDPIKTHPNFSAGAFGTRFGSFMRLWLQLLPTNKQVYLDAWLLQTLGYWKVDFHGWTALTSEYERPTGIAQHDVWRETAGLPSRDFFAARTGFFTLSLLAYVVLFCMAHLVAAGRGRYALALLPMLALWAGLMLGAPAYAEFRYLLLLPLALPVVVFMGINPSSQPSRP